MTIQAITHHTQTTTITFSEKPNNDIRQKLNVQGYRYRGQSRWVLTINESAVHTQEEVLNELS